MKPTSQKAAQFTESVIREMSRVCAKYQGVNLAQGFPDFPAPDWLKAAAQDAISRDQNQYAITWGAAPFRQAIAAKYTRDTGLPCDPETEVTVCCGVTESMIATLFALIDPGDEVVIFEPYYENYGPDAVLCGATPRFVTLRPPDYTFQPEDLDRAFSDRTKAVILNTPNNPTGKVFTREELTLIAGQCERHDAYCVTDEIYEHIVYAGAAHIYPSTLPGMRERTCFISGLSKTFSVTGWRLGYIVAPPAVTGAIRKVHDFLTVGAAAPLQAAGAVACAIGPEYYTQLLADYTDRRALMCEALAACGYGVQSPAGAYYVMADIAPVGGTHDVEFAMQLVREAHVATVPGSSFFADPADGRQLIRFCFPKRRATLERAARLLKAHHGV